MSGFYLKLKGSDERWELRPGTVIREQHRHGQERVVHAVHSDYVRCVGIASQRRTRIKRSTLAERYRVVDYAPRPAR